MLFAFNTYILNLLSKDISILKSYSYISFFLYTPPCIALHSKYLADKQWVLKDCGS